MRCYVHDDEHRDTTFLTALHFTCLSVLLLCSAVLLIQTLLLLLQSFSERNTSLHTSLMVSANVRICSDYNAHLHYNSGLRKCHITTRPLIIFL